MKRILCYGDSNTYGYNPEDGSRFDNKTRWTAILQDILGNNYKIIDESACDRTGFTDNPKGFLYSAQKHFPQILSKNNNLNVIILAVGTNDLQFQYKIDYSHIKKNLLKLIQTGKTKSDQIIIIPPIILDNHVLNGYFSYQFDETSIAKSKQAVGIFKDIAYDTKCIFFDINEFTQPSDVDGLHYDSFSHKIIAYKLSELINRIQN